MEFKNSSLESGRQFREINRIKSTKKCARNNQIKSELNTVTTFEKKLSLSPVVLAGTDL